MQVNIRGEELQLHELVGRYELDPIEIDNEGSFVFAIDIYRETTGLRKYFPKVYRYEFYRLRPSFPFNANNSENQECDEELLVEDSSTNWSENRMDSSKEVLEFVLKRIKDIFDKN